MSEREADWTDRVRGGDLGRRDALKAAAAAGLALGGAKTVDNVLVGYGVLTGTNLVDMDLAPFVRERFAPSAYATEVGDASMGYGNGRLELSAGGRVERLPANEASVDRAVALDGEFGLDGRFARLARDVAAVHRGDYRFEFAPLSDFLARVTRASNAGTSRPDAVGALRGARFDPAEPGLVREFADVDPADTVALVSGLAAGFRAHGGYDFARYAAGSVEDNLLFGAGDLRAPFRSPTSFEALLAGRNSGLFCYDFTYRSVEALHSVAAVEQSLPVAGAVVTDARHKHVYTGVASVLREDDGLVVPMTFLDYMHSTQYDDLHLRGVLGEGLNAYDRRHRTDDVYWNRYARW